MNLSVVQFHLEDSERFMQRLQNLKGLGVQLAIDDFGTGYSNLAYLQRFQVDKLKIDKSFVTDLSSNDQNLAIVVVRKMVCIERYRYGFA